MGTRVAVYDTCVRVKVQELGAKVPARRRAKRRGGRAGSRSTGKRRRLVTARPPSHEHSPHQGVCCRTSYVGERKHRFMQSILTRVIHLEERLKVGSGYRTPQRLQLLQARSRLVDHYCDIAGFGLGRQVGRIYFNMAMVDRLESYNGITCDSTMNPCGTEITIYSRLDDGTKRKVRSSRTGGGIKPVPKTRQVVEKSNAGKRQPLVSPERKRTGKVANRGVYPCCGLLRRDAGRGHSKLCPNHSSRVAGAT